MDVVLVDMQPYMDALIFSFVLSMQEWMVHAKQKTTDLKASTFLLIMFTEAYN